MLQNSWQFEDQDRSEKGFQCGTTPKMPPSKAFIFPRAIELCSLKKTAILGNTIMLFKTFLNESSNYPLKMAGGSPRKAETSPEVTFTFTKWYCVCFLPL